MKVLILNGSPRKNGNTVAALKALQTGLEKHHEVEWIDVCSLKLRGCINCDGCKRNGGNCVLNDGGAEFMQKVEAADLLLFGSPVYWWGISGQLKLALDKFYSKDTAFHAQKKKLGMVAVGAADLNDPEYSLISRQFKCIADFLGWEMVLDESVCAGGAGELAGNAAKLAEFVKLGETIR